MKAMKSASEFYVPPPAGAYRAVIIAAEAGFTKSKGESQIALEIELAEGPGKGESGKKWLGTDGGTKYGAMSKSAWRALGVNVDSDAEQSDESVAASLIGRPCIAVIEHEQMNSKNPVTEAYDVPATYVDANGAVQPLMRWVVKGFKSTATAGIQAALQPQTQAAVQAAPVQQFAAPPFAGQQAPGGFNAPAFAQPQFQPQQAVQATPTLNPATGQWELNGQPLGAPVSNGAVQQAQPAAAGAKKRARTEIQDV